MAKKQTKSADTGSGKPAPKKAPAKKAVAKKAPAKKAAAKKEAKPKGEPKPKALTLKQQLEAMQARVDALTKENSDLKAGATAPKPAETKSESRGAQGNSSSGSGKEPPKRW